MVWWPWKSKNQESDLGLTPESKKYHDSIINQVNDAEPVSQKDQSTPEHGAPATPILSVPTFTPDSKGQRVKPLKQIAMDNCVEFENAYSKCLTHGSYFERIASCQPQLTRYEQCKNMQIEALEMLGYARATTDAERKAIKALADDLMIDAVPKLTITEPQVERFHRLVQAAVSNR